MDARLQRRVQRYGWDKAAGHYERFWARQLRPAQERLLELAALRPGEQVIETACGTGLVTLPAADAVGEQGAVLATDLSAEMVEAVRRAAAARPQVTVSRMDAEALEVSDGTFDVALCSLGLMYAPDPEAAVVEMHRVVRTGGRAVASVWGTRSKCGWADIFPIVDSRVRSEVCPMFFRLGTGESLERAFGAAGFEELRVDRFSITLAYEGDGDAVGAAFAGGPVALAYARFDDATREEAHAEYLASIAPFRRADGGYEVPGEFVVVAGRRAREQTS